MCYTNRRLLYFTLLAKNQDIWSFSFLVEISQWYGNSDVWIIVQVGTCCGCQPDNLHLLHWPHLVQSVMWWSAKTAIRLCRWVDAYSTFLIRGQHATWPAFISFKYYKDLTYSLRILLLLYFRKFNSFLCSRSLVFPGKPTLNWKLSEPEKTTLAKTVFNVCTV